MSAATLEQIRILRHALGTGTDGRGRAYRNHFVTGAGSIDHSPCVALVQLGLMRRHAPSQLSGGDDVFSVTEAGKSAAAPDPDTLSRAQRRYAAYLEADSGLTFGEWLRCARDRLASQRA